MSLYFKAVRWMNFLSTGNQWTEIDLNKHTTNLVVGENGAGKSTMLDAILFALYGRPYRDINKPKLVNSVTDKHCLVELEFRTKNKTYFIRRGIKPAIFEIYCDDQLIDQNANTREYQEFLEKYILQMSFKSFTQIVVVGSANFVPFMQLRSNERREVIEDLLDIKIFSNMLLILKEKVSANKSELTECKYQIDLAEQRIELIKKHMNDIRSLHKTNRTAKVNRIKDLQEFVKRNTEQVAEFQAKIQTLQDEIKDHHKIKERMNKLFIYESEIKSNIKRAENHIEFFESHNECPTCMQDIDEDFKIKFIETKKVKKNEFESGLQNLHEVVKDTTLELESISSVQKEISEYNNTILKLTTNNESLQAQIAQIQDELSIEDDNTKDASAEREELSKNKTKLKELSAKHKELIERQEVYSISTSILRDGGIKTQIIKQYVPIINKLMNKYLSQLEFFVQFELDENFNESIKSRYRDAFSYNSFSEGEKARLDLALLFTWRAIAKMRNSTSSNLLIMDEVFDGSLDDGGTGYLMGILTSLGEDSNIFVISHKGDQLYDKFENILEFKKEKNFSQLKTKGV